MIRIFENPQLDLKMQMITDGGQHYFKAKEVALALGYESPKEAVRQHVSSEYRKRLSDIRGSLDLHNAQPHSVYISELGLYELVLGSELPAAKKLRRWVFEEVSPAIREPAKFKALNKQMFKIENEFDLHVKVVDYIRRFQPQLLFIAGLGELQDTSGKRIRSWQKGYQKGQPDLIIASRHSQYRGLCLEFKTPKGNGRLSSAQAKLLDKYSENGHKVLISNDYDPICECIRDYAKGIP